MSLEISTDRERLDVDLIHRYLSEESYWAAGIPRDLLERALDHSLCFGAFEEDEQVAFARVVTDQATYAWLCDVFVLESHRGRGIAKALLQAVVDHPALHGLRRWTLATRDAHGLYTKFGFTPIASPERMMEIVVRNPYVQ